ncbi:MAG TPA: biotin/lipoyl-binding protein [Thermoflexia bacterium]|jgi:biotin carboxyl carrier protein|nr:biotin/lipoyl-binding protein [Thermoflexia bacterium]
MKQEFTITLNGIEYPVVVEGDTITVNGRPFTVEVTDDGTVYVDGIAYEVAVEEKQATVEGATYDYEVHGLTVTATAAPTPAPPAAAPPSVEAGAGAVLAIMPGKIVRVMVEPGQKVEEGDPVCVLEAMKMENELHARKSGTVKAVHVKPGDDVEKDQVLVEIE